MFASDFSKGAFMGIDVMLAGFYQTSSDLWDLKVMLLGFFLGFNGFDGFEPEKKRFIWSITLLCKFNGSGQTFV